MKATAPFMPGYPHLRGCADRLGGIRSLTARLSTSTVPCRDPAALLGCPRRRRRGGGPARPVEGGPMAEEVLIARSRATELALGIGREALAWHDERGPCFDSERGPKAVCESCGRRRLDTGASGPGKCQWDGPESCSHLSLRRIGHHCRRVTGLDRCVSHRSCPRQPWARMRRTTLRRRPWKSREAARGRGLPLL